MKDIRVLVYTANGETVRLELPAQRAYALRGELRQRDGVEIVSMLRA